MSVRIFRLNSPLPTGVGACLVSTQSVLHTQARRKVSGQEFKKINKIVTRVCLETDKAEIFE